MLWIGSRIIAIVNGLSVEYHQIENASGLAYLNLFLWADFGKAPVNGQFSISPKLLKNDGKLQMYGKPDIWKLQK